MRRIILSSVACLVLLFCHIFPRYLMNGTILGEKKLLNIICVFWFSLQRLFETFLMIIIIQRDIVINVNTTSCNWSTHYFCKILVKLNFLNRFSKKCTYIKFSENHSNGRRVTSEYADGQMNKHDAVLRARLKRAYYLARLYEYESLSDTVYEVQVWKRSKTRRDGERSKGELKLVVLYCLRMLWKRFNWKTLVIT
jgi:hypothetical protein